MNNGDKPADVPVLASRTDKLRSLIIELEEIQLLVRDKISLFKSFTQNSEPGKDNPDASGKNEDTKFTNATMDKKLHLLADRVVSCIKEECLILERLKELI